MIELNELLRKVGLDPDGVIVMRHRPTETALRQALPWLAAEQPDLYNAYQSSHWNKVEMSLGRASHLASFLGQQSGKALFVGVYRVVGWKDITSEEFWAMECNRELGKLGTRGPPDGGTSRWFELSRTEHLASWKGKLVVEWPGIERSWWRWAGRNTIPVHAILQESLLVGPMPAWKELNLDWAQLQALPRSWQTTIAQWRGIYVILDCISGKLYVGSAYGAENILARWRAYATTGDGGNVGLKGRNPAQFRFAVLERVSPDIPSEEVIRLEETWKARLGTREFGLNRN